MEKITIDLSSETIIHSNTGASYTLSHSKTPTTREIVKKSLALLGKAEKKSVQEELPKSDSSQDEGIDAVPMVPTASMGNAIQPYYPQPPFVCNYGFGQQPIYKTLEPLPNGLQLPIPQTILPPPISIAPCMDYSPADATPSERLRNSKLDLSYRTHDNLKEENELLVREQAELSLNEAVSMGAKETQKYFPTGGSTLLVRMQPSPYTAWIPVDITAKDNWNLVYAKPSLQYGITCPNGEFHHIEFDLSNFSLSQTQPLLAISTFSNYRDTSSEHMTAMAYRICEDYGLDPSCYPENCNKSFSENSPLRFSVLSEQHFPLTSIPFRGKGGQTRYYIQKAIINDGSGSNQQAIYLPLVQVVREGCPINRPSYIPPENSLFLRQDEILSHDGRTVFMTNNFNVAFDAFYIADFIVTTAWRIEDCLNDDGVLPWAIFKGKVIFYLLIVNSDPNVRKREFEMAMRICAKLKSAGSAHPKVITAIDGQIGDVVYEENSFWKLRNGLGIEDADMGDFPDLDEQPELPGGPTAIVYIKLKDFMLVLGEQKAGKTWMSLLLACRMAFNRNAPKAVVYFYGEGEKYELEERLEIVKAAWCSASNTTDGEVVMVNLNDRNWGDEGFDLKLNEHQVYFDEKLREIKEHLQYPLVAIIIDNYASVMGKNQEGSNAIKLLEFIKKYQRQGLAVLLACHTNSSFEVAGSIHLPRRTNGIIRLTRKSLWQEKIKQEMDAAVKRAGFKTDPLTVLDNAFEDALERINEEETSRSQINLHVSFATFRNALPSPEEITINIPEKTITSTIVDAQVKTDFLNDYRNKLLEKMQKDDESTDEESDRSQKTVTAIPAQPKQQSLPSPYTFDEIKGMSSIEELKAALAKVVEVCNVRTRPELAEALKISEDTLKNFMKGRIRNEDIGLQDKAGRPSKKG